MRLIDATAKSSSSLNTYPISDFLGAAAMQRHTFSRARKNKVCFALVSLLNLRVHVDAVVARVPSHVILLRKKGCHRQRRRHLFMRAASFLMPSTCFIACLLFACTNFHVSFAIAAPYVTVYLTISARAASSCARERESALSL